MKITRKAGHALAKGRPVPGDCAFTMGAAGHAIRAFFAAQCRRKRLRIEDYGRQWGIYHRRPITEFEFTTTAGIREANALGNLEVRPLHNRPAPPAPPASSPDPHQPSLFPDDR